MQMALHFAAVLQPTSMKLRGNRTHKSYNLESNPCVGMLEYFLDPQERYSSLPNKSAGWRINHTSMKMQVGIILQVEKFIKI